MSFSDERLKNEGRLSGMDLEAKRIEIAARGLINSLRNLLGPHEELRELSSDMISDQALRLSDLLVQHRDAREKIQALRRALGR